MKIASFFIFICFFVNSIFGLKCFNSVGKNIYGKKTCSSTDKFCAKMSVYDPYRLPRDFPLFYQGCSEELEEIYDVTCQGYGSWRVGNGIGAGEWYGNLFCCNSNICNSANNKKIYATVIFVIIINVFIYFK